MGFGRLVMMQTSVGIQMLLVCLVLYVVPCEAGAQVTGSTTAPESTAFGFGVHHFVSGGHPSWRFGGVLYLSRTERLSVTAQFRDDDSYIEAEHRWLKNSQSPLRPFLSLSGVFLREGTQRSLGPAMGGGLEFHPIRSAILEASFAWHTLFGIGRSADRHGLRISTGVSLILSDWPG